jgi:putative acetyltransferase
VHLPGHGVSLERAGAEHNRLILSPDHKGSIVIHEAGDGAVLRDASLLLAEYLALPVSGGPPRPLPLAFQAEVDGLPGPYGPPGGRLLVARLAARAVGVVAARRVDSETIEMLRLYVRPEARRAGVGRRLSEAVIAWAQEAGGRRVRLDVWPLRAPAILLYRSLGFRAVRPFHRYPFPMLFLEVALAEAGARELRPGSTRGAGRS